jgi:hypothetical protein
VVAVARGIRRFALITVSSVVIASVSAVKGAHLIFQQTVAVSVVCSVAVRRRITKTISITVSFVVRTLARIHDFVWPPDDPPGGWGSHANAGDEWPISQDTEDDEWAGIH